MAQAGDALGEEVHRLVTAVQDWARRFPAPDRAAGGASAAGGATTAGGASAAEAAAAGHAPGADCVPWCPICQFANILRGEHPEVTERLAEAATAVAAAMKALADTALTRAPADADRGQERPKPSPRVQHIRIDDPSES
jgi:hypothetical protein